MAASMQQPVLMGREAFKAAWKHLNGETPEKEILIPTIISRTKMCWSLRSN